MTRDCLQEACNFVIDGAALRDTPARQTRCRTRVFPSSSRSSNFVARLIVLSYRRAPCLHPTPAPPINIYIATNLASRACVDIRRHACNEHHVPIRRHRGCEFLPRAHRNTPTHAEFELAACSAKLGANFSSPSTCCKLNDRHVKGFPR